MPWSLKGLGFFHVVIGVWLMHLTYAIARDFASGIIPINEGPSTMKPRCFPILILSAFTLMAAAPDGKTIAYNGNGNGAASCSTCHGDHFQGNPALPAPALAGLSASFILARLAHYKSPTGHNALMKQEASALTPAESQAVAVYLASLPKT